MNMTGDPSRWACSREERDYYLVVHVQVATSYTVVTWLGDMLWLAILKRQ